MPAHAANWKDRIYPYMPKMIRRARRALFGWRWFRGHYANWEEAQRYATGYTEPDILKKVLRATLEVKAGRAAYERDSVLFFEPAVETELLACLKKVAARNGGRLRVLDFGGSLGTTYWQHRGELAGLVELRWDVVEQKHFVEAGKKHFEDDTLRFFPSVADAMRAGPHDVLLASTVIQFLPAPHELLADWASLGWPCLILHNVPLHPTGSDYIRIEHVPPEIYPAVYPMWFFNRDGLLAHFEANYELERTYASTAIWDCGWRDYPSSGLMFRLRPLPTRP